MFSLGLCYALLHSAASEPVCNTVQLSDLLETLLL